jgi:Fe-S-cluster containining protein
MIKEVKVIPETRWECVSCGRCCYKLGKEFNFKLFGSSDGKCVKLNERGRCGVYNERPLGCKMYPFYPDWEKLKIGVIDFKLGGLKIDSDCSGYGKGQRIVRNKRLLKRLDKVALELKKRMMKNKGGKIKDLFME